jgi:hypothetical protein
MILDGSFLGSVLKCSLNKGGWESNPPRFIDFTSNRSKSLGDFFVFNKNTNLGEHTKRISMYRLDLTPTQKAT